MEGEPDRIDLKKTLEQSGWLKVLAIHLVGPDQADDLVQDAWVRTLERPPRKPASLRHWLARVLTNLSIDSRRSEVSRRRRELEASRSRGSEAVEETPALLEVQEQVMHAVQALREPYRTTIVLHYYEGLAAKQIADRFGVSSSTVRNRLARGLHALRRTLEARHGRGWRETSLVLLLPSSSPLIPSVATTTGLEALLMTMKSKSVMAIAALAVITGFIIWPEDPDLRTGIIEEGVNAPTQTSEPHSDNGNSGTNHPVDARAQITSSRTSIGGGSEGLYLRAVDESGAAIPSARARAIATDLSLEALTGSSLDYYPPSLVPDLILASGEDGLIHLDSLSPDRSWALFVEADGFACRVMVADAGFFQLHTPILDFTLETGRFLALRLEDKDGQPISQARVRTSGEPPKLDGTLSGQVLYSDENGNVDFRSLQDRTRNLYVSAPGILPYQELDLTFSQSLAASRVVVLDRGESISLTVLESDGAPARGVEVYKERGYFHTALTRLNPRFGSADGSFQGKTDSDGNLQVGGLDQDRRTWGIAIRRGRAWALSESVRAGDSLTLQLPPVHALIGQVLLNDGSPAVGAKLVIINEEEPVFPPDYEAELGVDGRFIAELPFGVYRLGCFHHSGSYVPGGSILLDQGIDLGEFTISPANLLTLSVLDPEDQPIADAEIEIDGGAGFGFRNFPVKDKDAFNLLVFLGSRSQFLGGNLRSDEDGRIQISCLPPGLHPFRISALGYSDEELEVEVTVGKEVERTVHLNVSAELLLNLIDQKGDPVGGIHLGLTPDDYDPLWRVRYKTVKPKKTPISGTASPDGTVHFPSIGTGTWHIGLGTRQNTGFYWESIEVHSGVNHHTVKVPPQSQVQFNLRGPSGPVEGASIEMQRRLPQSASPPPGVQINLTGTGKGTDSAGRWSCDAVEAGTYRIKILTPGAFPLQEDIQVHADATNFHFQLQGASISGMVGHPPDGTRVYLATFSEEPDDPTAANRMVRHRFWDRRGKGVSGVGGFLSYSSVAPQMDGSFRFYAIPPGIYYLVASAPGYLATEPQRVAVGQENSEGNRLSLSRAASVRLHFAGIAAFKRKYPGIEIHIQAISASGKNLFTDSSLIRNGGTMTIGPLEPGSAEISIFFLNDVPDIPEIKFHPDITAGEVTQLQWDASSL